MYAHIFSRVISVFYIFRYPLYRKMLPRKLTPSTVTSTYFC